MLAANYIAYYISQRGRKFLKTEEFGIVQKKKKKKKVCEGIELHHSVML